jgi:hypothetical protein
MPLPSLDSSHIPEIDAEMGVFEPACQGSKHDEIYPAASLPGMWQSNP